jgi:hypothetical protein
MGRHNKLTCPSQVSVFLASLVLTSKVFIRVAPNHREALGITQKYQTILKKMERTNALAYFRHRSVKKLFRRRNNFFKVFKYHSNLSFCDHGFKATFNRSRDKLASFAPTNTLAIEAERLG